MATASAARLPFPQAALIAKSFTPRLRYSGSALGYQLASVIAGGPAPLIATALFAAYQTGLCHRGVLYRCLRSGEFGLGGSDARLYRQGYLSGICPDDRDVRLIPGAREAQGLLVLRGARAWSGAACRLAKWPVWPRSPAGRPLARGQANRQWPHAHPRGLHVSYTSGHTLFLRHPRHFRDLSGVSRLGFATIVVLVTAWSASNTNRFIPTGVVVVSIGRALSTMGKALTQNFLSR